MHALSQITPKVAATGVVWSDAVSAFEAGAFELNRTEECSIFTGRERQKSDDCIP